MIEGMSLRPYEDGDTAAITALHALAFERLAAPHHSAAEIAAHTELTNGADYPHDFRRSNLMLAFGPDGELVATAGWIRQEDEAATARIRKVFVRPDLARRGLGSAMVRDAERRALACGYPHMIVRANLNAVPLYARLGYERLREGRMPTPAGVDLPVVFMRKHRAGAVPAAPSAARGQGS